MVPGEFNTVIPLFSASPLLGLIWASYPSSNAILIPVGISLRSIGFKVTGASRNALKSIPADCSVAYVGNGLLLRLTILNFFFVDIFILFCFMCNSLDPYIRHISPSASFSLDRTVTRTIVTIASCTGTSPFSCQCSPGTRVFQRALDHNQYSDSLACLDAACSFFR